MDILLHFFDLPTKAKARIFLICGNATLLIAMFLLPFMIWLSRITDSDSPMTGYIIGMLVLATVGITMVVLGARYWRPQRKYKVLGISLIIGGAPAAVIFLLLMVAGCGQIISFGGAIKESMTQLIVLEAFPALPLPILGILSILHQKKLDAARASG
jgi:hypothetical protein